ESYWSRTSRARSVLLLRRLVLLTGVGRGCDHRDRIADEPPVWTPGAPSEVEPGEASGLAAQHDDRRSWLDAVHVPRRWALRRRVERSGDARARRIQLGRPAALRPGLGGAFDRVGVGDPPGLALHHHVRVQDRDGHRAAGVALDVVALAGPGARLEPVGAVEPDGTDGGDVGTAVVVDRREPGGAGVVG